MKSLVLIHRWGKWLAPQAWRSICLNQCWKILFYCYLNSNILFFIVENISLFSVLKNNEITFSINFCSYMTNLCRFLNICFSLTVDVLIGFWWMNSLLMDEFNLDEWILNNAWIKYRWMNLLLMDELTTPINGWIIKLL